MGNNKETRARRNEWERTFPRLFACFRAFVECMRSRRELFVSRGCVLSYTILFLVQVRWTRVVPIKLASWIESPLGPRSMSPPLATILGRVRFLWWYFWLEKRGWNVSRAFRIASFGIKSIRDLRRDIIFRFTNDERWNLKKETVYCYIIFEDARERIF